MTPAWYVARSKQGGEYLLRDGLEAVGIEVFLPSIKRIKPLNLSRHREEIPLFPGYLFIKYALGENGWRHLNQFPQFAGLVNFGGVIASIPEEEILHLSERVAAANERGGLWKPFQAGEQVKVTFGRTQSLAQVVECSKSPRTRVKVLMEFLGRLIHAEVPLEAVQPLDARQAVVGQLGSRAPRRTRGKGRWIRGFGARVSEY